MSADRRAGEDCVDSVDEIESGSFRSSFRVPLGELALLKTGPFGSALHKSDYVRDGIPVINPMHIIQNRIIPSNDMRISPEVFARLSEFALQEGDVVIGRRGVMGRCAVVGRKEAGWLCGTGSAIIRPQNGVDPNYLQRFLSSPDVVSKLEGESVGSTMTNLNQGILRSILVPLPPLPEQKRIADKLDRLLARVDACRERLDRVPALLKRFRQSVLAAATTGELTREWREARGITDGPFNNRISLGKLCSESFYGPRFGQDEYNNSGVPTIRTTDMTRDGRINITTETPRVIVPPEKLAKFAVRKGDLLVTRTGSIGVMAVFEDNYVAVPGAYLIRFRFSEVVLPREGLNYPVSRPCQPANVTSRLS